MNSFKKIDIVTIMSPTTNILNTKPSTKQIKKQEKKVYFSGTYIEEREAPIPGVP